MPAQTDTSTMIASETVALRLAETLEQLIALVNRELNVEANEGVQIADPRWAAAICRVVDYSTGCVAVLDEPAVLDALTTALARSR